MQQHNFEAQLPQARVLTDEELLQIQGGSFFDYARSLLQPIVHPIVIGQPWGGALGNVVQRIWQSVKQAV
jgi:hypothetical protein